MKNKKLLGVLMTGMLMMSAGSVLAQEAEYSEESPYYVLVMWGQENLGGGLPARIWDGSITSENAKFSVAKEILIGSGEKLENSVMDLGVADDNLEIGTSSKYRQGVILRVLEEAGMEGSLNIGMGGLEAEVSIPVESENVVDSSDAFLKVMNLQNNENLSLEERNRLFRNKLAIIKSTAGLEIWANQQYDKGEISRAVAESLKLNLDKSLAANFDNDAKVAAFEYKYSRIRNLVNDKKIAPGVAAGAIQRLLKDAQD
ncbi:MAG: hypothetical protein ACRCZE_02810 [Candidatus Altimarinota bacterium]